MSRLSEVVHKRMIKILSLPERAVRALSAIVVGASTLLTETLFPEALRGTTTYRISIGMMQEFILQEIAGMESDIQNGQVELNDRYVQRKMAGTALEAAGLLAMRFSPLWVFTFAGDAVGGGRVYLNRLVEHLKENKLLDEETKIKDLLGLLEEIQQATSQTAIAIDMPPLSREELSELVRELKTEYTQAFDGTVNLVPKLEDIWNRMEQLAKRENISIERLGGLMTVDAVSFSRRSANIVLAAGKTGAALLDEKILDSYRETLTKASERGVDTYISDHMNPFLQAAKSHFDSNRETWIEKKFGGSGENSE